MFRFPWEMRSEWKCGFCNHVFESPDRPESCPFCHRKGDFDIFLDMIPFPER